MKKLIIIFILFSSNFAFSQRNLGYSWGITSSFDLLQPKHYASNFQYFSSTYTNGYSINLGLTNKLNYKKMFLRVDFAYNRAAQRQTFVFSNASDLIISETVQHVVPHFTFDWSIGRDFALKSGNIFQIEVGLSATYRTDIGLYENRLRLSGSFLSSNSDQNNHWNGQLGYKEYDYEFEYQRNNSNYPFCRIGFQVPLKNNYLTYGLTAKMRRLVYENFIVLSSDTYSAIANSRSQSSSFGVFVSYQFGKR
jgi:hypothetical protein